MKNIFGLFASITSFATFSIATYLSCKDNPTNHDIMNIVWCAMASLSSQMIADKIIKYEGND